MGFSYFNPNPAGQKVGDCTVRAIAKATGKSWDEVYIGLCLQGLIMGDLPSANSVWSAYLRQQGFTRNVIPNTCPDCYTVADFCADHPRGCCLTVAAKNTSAQAISFANSNMIVERVS